MRHMGRETREMLFRPMSEWRKASLRSPCVSRFALEPKPNLSFHRLTRLLAFIRLFGCEGRLQHFILLIVNKFNGGNKANCVPVHATDASEWTTESIDFYNCRLSLYWAPSKLHESESSHIRAGRGENTTASRTAHKQKPPNHCLACSTNLYICSPFRFHSLSRCSFIKSTRVRRALLLIIIICLSIAALASRRRGARRLVSRSLARRVPNKAFSVSTVSRRDLLFIDSVDPRRTACAYRRINHRICCYLVYINLNNSIISLTFDA